jgi:AcrR family transcriptional regulator
MRRIAEKIEYSPTTIYLYFKDKPELFHSLCEELFLRLVRDLDKISKSARAPTKTCAEGFYVTGTLSGSGNALSV